MGQYRVNVALFIETDSAEAAEELAVMETTKLRQADGPVEAFRYGDGVEMDEPVVPYHVLGPEDDEGPLPSSLTESQVQDIFDTLADAHDVLHPRETARYCDPAGAIEHLSDELGFDLKAPKIER